ncbi:hypothetical protein EHS13_04770 [Paenibacillus psychroresistens]|uniref:Uncharacterized protein n=1 Tax=Paenibacillus psychroresistens TaxID=1778678 RepID=A0A6B8REW4_9BACL|nr:hypothetical protein [Paenibacillus psychroresistens]QGQ94264.1 hypothetical protein EHS13_04770 [Paenibacillus psychroresistens]
MTVIPANTQILICIVGIIACLTYYVRKRSTKAVLITLISPGMGHLYLGSYKSGFMYLSIPSLIIITFPLVFSIISLLIFVYLWVVFLAFIVLWIVCIVDVIDLSKQAIEDKTLKHSIGILALGIGYEWLSIKKMKMG